MRTYPAGSLPQTPSAFFVNRAGFGVAVFSGIANDLCSKTGQGGSIPESLLRPAMERSMEAEALPQSARCCRVVPALLGERLGDVASLAIAAEL